MVIDIHHHLPRDWREYIPKLRDKCAELKINRVAMCTSGPPGAGNLQIYEALQEHGDFLLGLGYVRIGEDGPRAVDDLHSMGFHGIKVIRPTVDYDDDCAMPVYERCALLNMPVLFHLGIVAASRVGDPLRDVSIDRMRPAHLDRIARKFPTLSLIGAHLGNPWYDEAGEVARMHPNVYFDLTGSTMKKKSPEFLSEVFWWAKNEQYGKMGDKHPYEKIVFGTDVSLDLMEDVLNDYRAFFHHVNMSFEHRQMIMGGTAAKIFGLNG
jgi:predicted TIM-barrel fold metal-dependent hydrolase